MLGLALLGLTRVYREGFETVLFLQSLELSAGTVTVLEGAGLGLALTLLVAVLTFALQRKLPYKKMLIATGVLIAVVLVVMVGQTARTMQGTGWLPITPAPFDVPYWAGLWFGVFPTWETLIAQVGGVRVRDRLLLPRPGGQGQAPAAQGRAGASEDQPDEAAEREPASVDAERCDSAHRFDPELRDSVAPERRRRRVIVQRRGSVPFARSNRLPSCWAARLHDRPDRSTQIR